MYLKSSYFYVCIKMLFFEFGVYKGPPTHKSFDICIYGITFMILAMENG